MRIDVLRTFVKLVECGSYTSAAKSLYMSVSTVYNHIKSLEEELQTDLVAWHHGSLQLTHAGNLLLLFAQKTVSEYERLFGDVNRRIRPQTASILVASLPSIGVHLLPPAIRAFVDYHPLVRITVDSRRTGEVFAVLRSGQADVAIVLDAHVGVYDSEFIIQEIMPQKGVFVAHNRTFINDINPAEILSRFPLSLQPPNNILRRSLERYATERGISLNVRFEHSSFDGIISDVLYGGCIGLVSDYVRHLHPMARHLQELIVPEFDVQHRIVALHRSDPPRFVMDFIDFLKWFYRDGVTRRHDDSD